MRVTNTHYNTLDALQKHLDISALDPDKTLLQIFSGFVTESEVQQIHAIIKKKNRDLLFIGTTTAGEIYEGDVYEKSIVVSVMEFEESTVKVDHFNNDDAYQLGKNIATSLFTPTTKATILFVDGTQTNANDLIDGISSVESSVTLAGGVAGDNGYLIKTFVFDHNGIYSKGCVAASLNSTKLHVFTHYQLNWQAIGKTMTVTKANKNRVYEIDGISPSAIYKKYLGERIGNNLPFSATEFPLLKIEENGEEICRAITHQFEDGSLATVGNLTVGDKVRLAFGNVDLILNNSQEAINTYHSLHPQAIYIYSCAVRKAFLQSEITAELSPFNAIAPNSGFFTYGEIYHNGTKNSLLSISMTLLALSEHDPKSIPLHTEHTHTTHKKQKNFLENKHYLVLEALTNLSNTVIAELEEAKQQLKEQANRDYLTGLYNRRYFNEVAQELIAIAKREDKPLSIVMMDIDKFKTINDTYGHSVGDDVIKRLSTTVLDNIRESDILSRLGGEEFVLLLPFTDKEGATKIAQKIRQSIANQELITEDGDLVAFTVSLGVASLLPTDINIEQSLKRADNALYKAKQNGRNQVIVN